jgi:hypothetical protein
VLYRERVDAKIPLSKNPFQEPENLEQAYDAIENKGDSSGEGYLEDAKQSGSGAILEINVADDVPWIDLVSVELHRNHQYIISTSFLILPWPLHSPVSRKWLYLDLRYAII